MGKERAALLFLYHISRTGLGGAAGLTCIKDNELAARLSLGRLARPFCELTISDWLRPMTPFFAMRREEKKFWWEGGSGEG